MSESTGPITVTRTALARLFTGSPDSVTLDGGVLHIGESDPILASAADAVETGPSWFWTRLTVHVAGGAGHAVGGLRRDDAERLARALREAAAQAATELAPELTHLAERVERFEASDRYRRHSRSRTLRADIAAAVVRISGALARAHLPESAAWALARIERLTEPRTFEAAREEANARHVAASGPAIAQATKGVLSSPPTDEQAAAIATDEDATLVLAGAGTGKTAVITGKVAHLVRNEGVPPADILVLAYNRKAAEEIRERFPDDLAGAHVATFHAFGRHVLAEAGTAPTMSKLAEDEAQLDKVIDSILVELLTDSQQSEAVIDFILRHRVVYRSQFDFRSAGEYYDYVRRSELRTLSSDLVKSFEELAIANFLTLNGVPFEYEGRYEVPTATTRHRQYQPDFHLPYHGIYIEHFALDREGRAPPDWRGYLDGVVWKRGIHAEHGTTLIETYSWQRQEGVLLDTLRMRLEELGVTFERVEIGKLIDDLRKGGLVTWLARLVASFLNHVKTSGLSLEDLRGRAVDSHDRDRSEAFLDVFEAVHARYEAMLAEEEALDFHDLINHAAAHIREGRWESPFHYILVDEFQDVSAGRMALLQALGRAGVAYFLVGDDWQSIYRFAGSDVGLVRDCGRYLGHVRERALGRTFRFAAGIQESSTAFVIRNPTQTRRALRPAEGVRDGGVTAIAAADPRRGLEDALRDIESQEGNHGPPVSVLVLGRYRGAREALPPRRPGRLRVEFSTVHAAKGREADYVVVLDLRDARRGFPSQLEDDPLLEIVLPRPPGGEYPHAEERRLFYVAMTRARFGAYLVADALRPSPFVEELRRQSPGLRQLGEFRRDRKPACPRCHTGRLDELASGSALYCLNFPFCRYRAPRCQTCGGGFLVIAGEFSSCTNALCDASPPFCDSCGAGVMVVRNGRNGRFLGCSEYASDQPCRNTRNLPARR
ncbi:MAG: UvrD-helicase domain-containing protein [Chloroflexi bacterium]|nr:UvrD-helicase domain-containing protein [Chloroflexota bacterium]